MAEKQVLILPHTAKFSEAQLQELREAGFIPLRVKDVNSIRVLSSGLAPIEGSRMLIHALRAIRDKDDWMCYRKFLDGIISDLVNTSE
jgi:hypothetical protein